MHNEETMDIDEMDQDDEGWIWLPWEELQELQRQKNALFSQMLDNVMLASGGPISRRE